MPRKDRITEPGYYHVISRGVERRNIYLENEDYNEFLNILKDVTNTFHIQLHAFCLMTNHYHLLIETKENNISEAMKRVNFLYAIYFNKKYKRTGHLWQGRFASYYLYDDVHFWYVAKYCERNPIKAKMVKSISDYMYQSFYQWKYKSEFYELIKESKIHEMTQDEYEEFIHSEFSEDIVEKIYDTPKYIKKDGELKILYKRIETFFTDENRKDNMKEAYEYGYTKADIAKYLNISHTSVSKILKNINL